MQNNHQARISFDVTRWINTCPRSVTADDGSEMGEDLGYMTAIAAMIDAGSVVGPARERLVREILAKGCPQTR